MIEIVLYSKPACVQCKATYQYFDKKALTYQVIDMSQDAEALERVRALGYLQAPVVEVKLDGETVEHWSGFRPDRIDYWKGMLAGAHQGVLASV